MALLTKAELEYRMDVAEGRYSTAIQNRGVPETQASPLTGLARMVVAWELLQEAWQHEKATARAELNVVPRATFRAGVPRVHVG